MQSHDPGHGRQHSLSYGELDFAEACAIYLSSLSYMRKGNMQYGRANWLRALPMVDVAPRL
eukprot:6177734-Pleurochrysis_carterae.AAC.4